MKKKLVVAAVAGVSVAALALMQTFVWAQEAAAEPKYTIKEVMGQAHKDGLLQKVVDGDATPEEKALLLDLYLSLLENDPPQGDADAFHEKAGEAVVAAARVVVGREGAEEEIKRAVNCAACHKDHKPPSE
jgi:hypothetical protein